MCSLIVRTTDQIHGLVKMLYSIALQGKMYAFAENYSLLGYINDDPYLCNKSTGDIRGISNKKLMYIETVWKDNKQQIRIGKVQ